MNVLDSIFGTGRIRAAKRVGLFMAAAFVAGIPLLLAGASSDNRILLTAGIVLVVLGFLPMLFIGDLINSVVSGLLRSAARAKAAADQGMTYSRVDRVGLDTAGFLGLGRGVAEHVATGTVGGRTVHWFEWSKGIFGRQGTLACAAVDLRAACPPLLLGRRGSGLDESELPRVELESVEFNRQFVVACRDRQFATTFCDATLMAWFIDTFPKDVHVEANGRFVVCWTPMRKGASGFAWAFAFMAMMRGGWERELKEVLATGAALSARVPRIIPSIWPAQGGDAGPAAGVASPQAGSE